MTRGMMKALGLFLAFLIAVPLGGFTTSTLWGWFLVPLGVPAIGIAHGCGISLVVGYLKGSKSESVKEQDDLEVILAKAFVTPPLFLGVGYLIHLVMGL